MYVRLLMCDRYIERQADRHVREMKEGQHFQETSVPKSCLFPSVGSTRPPPPRLPTVLHPKLDSFTLFTLSIYIHIFTIFNYFQSISLSILFLSLSRVILQQTIYYLFFPLFSSFPLPLSGSSFGHERRPAWHRKGGGRGARSRPGGGGGRCFLLAGGSRPEINDTKLKATKKKGGWCRCVATTPTWPLVLIRLLVVVVVEGSWR